jgi:hypothetical protein
MWSYQIPASPVLGLFRIHARADILCNQFIEMELNLAV